MSNRAFRAVVFLLLSFIANATASEPTATEVFNQRILPIFRSEKPSSCVQCHLSSVDLKNYILPSSDATFASLRDQGLVDMDDPEKSKILTLIRMGDKDADEGAKMIHADMRQSEFTAFSEWVKSCCADDRMRDLPSAEEIAKPEQSNLVIRHARKSRVMDSFVRNVWSQRMRCFPCHTPHEIDPENPKHQAGIKTRKKFEESYGEDMLKRLDIFHETPEATLSYLIESSRNTPDDRLPMLDLEDPTKSLLVQKPMSKLPKKNEDKTFEPPSYKFPVSHMGGLKLHKNDQGYKTIVSWIEDYSNVVAGKYKTVEELPADNWYPSKMVVRLKNAPESWAVGSVVQMFVHEWNEQEKDWNDEPIAFSQNSVTPRHMVNGFLFLLGNGDPDRTASWDEDVKLPRGRFLVKTYLDSGKKVANDPSVILTSADFQGELEIEKARWRPGFRFAEVVDLQTLASEAKTDETN